MDGKPIGVEVTELTVDNTEREEYVKGQEGSQTNVIFGPGQWKQESRESRLDTPVPNMANWSLDKFWKKLEERVQRKDEIARKWNEKGKLIQLNKLFLLIVTGERMLQVSLEQYLKEISIPSLSILTLSM